MDNPSLRAEPRYQQAPVLPSTGEPSILEWLEKSGRLISRDDDVDLEKILGDEEEISALMGTDDSRYEDEDDDFDDDDDLDD